MLGEHSFCWSGRVGSGRVKTWSAERLDHDHCHWLWSGCGRVVAVTMVNSNKLMYCCNYLYLYKGERDERPGDSGRATDPNRTERDYIMDQSATLTSLYLPGQPVLVQQTALTDTGSCGICHAKRFLQFSLHSCTKNVIIA